MTDHETVFFDEIPSEKHKSHDGKVEHATFADAILDLADIKKNHPDWGFMLAYPCRYGDHDHWHLGHSSMRKKRKKQKHGRKRQWRVAMESVSNATPLVTVAPRYVARAFVFQIPSRRYRKARSVLNVKRRSLPRRSAHG